MAVKLQAREIIRAAKRFGFELRRGNPARCALAPPARVVGYTEAPWFGSIEPVPDQTQIQKMAEHFKVQPVDLAALEMGFENHNHTHYPSEILKKSRYYKVGRNIARKLNLEPA